MLSKSAMGLALEDCAVHHWDILYEIDIYQVECSKCNNSYIVSTIRLTYDRTKEHLGNTNSSVLKHLVQCQLDLRVTHVHIIARDKDLVNVRLLKARNIRTL